MALIGWLEWVEKTETGVNVHFSQERTVSYMPTDGRPEHELWFDIPPFRGLRSPARSRRVAPRGRPPGSLARARRVTRNRTKI